jgi:hypothetical protein
MRPRVHIRFMAMIIVFCLFLALIVPVYLTQEGETCKKKGYMVAFPSPRALPYLRKVAGDLDPSMMYVFYEDEACPNLIADAVCGSYQKCADEVTLQLQLGGGVEDSER